MCSNSNIKHDSMKKMKSQFPLVDMKWCNVKYSLSESKQETQTFFCTPVTVKFKKQKFKEILYVDSFAFLLLKFKSLKIQTIVFFCS